MTPQEAIEIIKTAIEEVEWQYPMNYTAAFDEAIKALEKQVPKKLIISEDSILCTSCGFDLMGCYDYPTDENPKHCPNCGRKIDWGG